MKLKNPQDLLKLTNLSLYRQLIKNIGIYPSVKKRELRTQIKVLFRKNIGLENDKEIKKQRKMACMGLAHVLMYNEKNEELRHNYTTTPTNYDSINPKDEDFIYF